MRRRLPLLAAGMLLAGTAWAAPKGDPFAHPPDAPPPTLERAELDSALPVRKVCQELVQLINRQGALWQLVREGARDRDAFRGDQRRLDEQWRSARSRCDLGIVDLERGLARDVLDHELQLMDSLQRSLGEVVTSYLSGAEVQATNELVAAYDASMRDWTAWLPRGSAFWNGALLIDPAPRSCLRDLQGAARGVSQELGRLAALEPEQRPEQRLVDVQAMLTGLRTELQRCGEQVADPAGRVEQELTARLLTSYDRFLAGVRGDDDDLIRAAMADEQTATARLVRCRQEYAAGSPTLPCLSP